MATKRKDGRWQSTKRTPTGTVTGYGRSPEEADADRDRKLQPILTDKSEIVTVHDFAGFIWRPHIQQNSPSTVKKYDGEYRKYIMPKLGPMTLADVRPPDIQEFVNWLTLQKVKGKPIAAATVRSICDRVASIFNLASEWDFITKTPVRGIRKPKKQGRRERVLSPKDTLQLIQYFDTTELSAPVYLAVMLGLRRGEAIGLTWDKVDVEAGTILIDHQITGTSKDSQEPKEPKHGSKRTIFLGPNSPIMQGILDRGDLDCKYVCSYGKTHWPPDTLTEKFADLKLGSMLPLSNWTFHDLRHLTAGLLNAAGVNPLAVSAILGHKRVEQTFDYMALLTGAGAAAMKQFSDFVSVDKDTHDTQ